MSANSSYYGMVNVYCFINNVGCVIHATATFRGWYEKPLTLWGRTRQYSEIGDA